METIWKCLISLLILAIIILVAALAIINGDLKGLWNNPMLILFIMGIAALAIIINKLR